jgi:predicted RNA binding protein YcfA (HicA-like mRNA interferase family)
MVFSTSDLRRALEAKGFRKLQGGSHTKFVLEVEGVVQAIWTVVSHSKHDISHGLQSTLARELRMPNPAYLRRYVECAVSEVEYLGMLRDKGVIG